MSMLGRAFAGFGAGVSSLASRYIDEELQANRLKLHTELQHQAAVRMDQYQNDPARRGMLREEAGKDATAAALAGAAGQRAAAVAGEGDTAYQAARSAGAVRDAKTKGLATVAEGMITSDYLRGEKAKDADAAAAAQRKATKDAAADPDFMKAQTAIKLADPEVAARIKASAAAAAASYASAGNSSAHAEQAREQTRGLKVVNDLKADADRILNDQGISDEERKKRLAVIDERLIAMGGKQRAARDPELDTVTIKETIDDGKGGTKEITRKEVRRPGAASAAPQAGPSVGTEVDGYVFKGGDPNKRENWAPKSKAAEPPQTMKDPLSGEMLTEPQWDKKFGRGDFRKTMREEESRYGSIKAF
jgi:hypothetical protein